MKSEKEKERKKDKEVEDVFVTVLSLQAFGRGATTANPDKTGEPLAHRGQLGPTHPAGPSHGAAKPSLSRPSRASRCDGGSPPAANPLARPEAAMQRQIREFIH